MDPRFEKTTGLKFLEENLQNLANICNFWINRVGEYFVAPLRIRVATLIQEREEVPLWIRVATLFNFDPFLATLILGWAVNALGSRPCSKLIQHSIA